jgi:hypothetical protein
MTLLEIQSTSPIPGFPVEYNTTIASTSQDYILATEYINQRKTYITSDGAIPLGFPTTVYASHRIRIEEDPKVHDSPIQGRISKDHAKTPIRARLCNL